MKRAALSVLAAGAAVTTAYLAWCQTVEGRFCGRMVTSELNRYAHRTSHASATANVARHC